MIDYFIYNFETSFGIGEIISSFSLLGVIIFYFCFKRKLSSQQKIINEQVLKLNDIQLNREHEKDISKSKSKLVFYVQKTDKWRFCIN